MGELSVKERPILFSAAMVRAILDGRKTQTRRVVKRPRGCPEDYILTPKASSQQGWTWWQNPEFDRVGWGQDCPYGKPGDRLWVRETWSHDGEGVWSIADARRLRLHGQALYAATHDGPKPLGWWPSIHMPREFSRITLEVTEVRVERLKEISEADAISEGLRLSPGGWWSGAEGQAAPAPRAAYGLLWNSINGPTSWDANPWVWVVGFRILP